MPSGSPRAEGGWQGRQGRHPVAITGAYTAHKAPVLFYRQKGTHQSLVCHSAQPPTTSRAHISPMLLSVTAAAGRLRAWRALRQQQGTERRACGVGCPKVFPAGSDPASARGRPLLLRHAVLSPCGHPHAPRGRSHLRATSTHACSHPTTLIANTVAGRCPIFRREGACGQGAGRTLTQRSPTSSRVAGSKRHVCP